MAGPTKVTVTWGGEKFSPVQFHVLDVGPLSLEVELPPGADAATVKATIAKAHSLLEVEGKRIFEEKAAAYVERMRQLGKLVRLG